MKLTKEQLVKDIKEWEQKAGESFVDYFMDDSVKALSWSFWLLGKGYTDHALNIIKRIEAGENYFDQQELFEIYPEYEESEDPEEEPKWNKDAFSKNVEIWAEFLVSTESYLKRVTNFFTDQSEEEDDSE